MTPQSTDWRSKMLRIAPGLLLFVFILAFVDPDPSNPSVKRTLAVAVLMAYLWLTDAIPMSATAFAPCWY